MYIVLKVVFE